MISLYTVGAPFETGAVTEEVPAQSGVLPYFREEGGAYVRTMAPGEVVYGLGEQVRGINKRGHIYVSDNTDDPMHLEEKRSLYASHNLLVIDGEEHFGIFFDTPGKVTFDLGYTRYEEMRILPEEPDCRIYLIEEGSSAAVVRAFRRLIGTSYIPPKWAFGYGQSRWGYRNAEDVRALVREYRERGLPLDMVYLDIDYMDNYKDFTVDPEAFPDFPDFVRGMKDEGVRLIPISDAGIKIEEGYGVYEEGRKNGYFLKDEAGNDRVLAVWPGRSCLPDFLNSRVRSWFGRNYHFLLRQGIEGFWNDMNEPAIFYSEDHLEEVFRHIDGYRTQNLDVNSYFALQGEVTGLCNRKEDYASLWHDADGRRIRHDRVHNLYGWRMTQAAEEGFSSFDPDKRFLMFSRASYIGMHRISGVWTGDNHSWWGQLLLNIQMMPSLNMCGFLYAGADIGGFGGDTTADLLLRWLEFGIFTPLLRNHSAWDTREQELFRFGMDGAFRGILQLRYCLLPYLYSEFIKAALTGETYFSPMGFAWPDDPRAKETEDQLLLGGEAVLAPVYRQNAAGRYVYLPEKMKLYRFRAPGDYDTEILTAGDHYVPCALGEVLLFVRKGRMIPFGESAEHVDRLSGEIRACLAFGEEASYELYDDDGTSKAVTLSGHTRLLCAETLTIL